MGNAVGVGLELRNYYNVRVLYSENMASASAYQPLLENGVPLTTHTIIEHTPDTVRSYISSMPKYKGNNIPDILTRERTLGPYERNYFQFFRKTR